MIWRRRAQVPEGTGDAARALLQARAVETDLRDVLATLREHLDELEVELSRDAVQFATDTDDA